MTIEQAMKEAVRRHQAGQLAEAEQLYRQILAQQPNHADALHLRGVVAYQLGRHDLAVELLGRALILKSDWPEALSNRGEALRVLGRLNEAVDDHRRAIDLDSGLAKVHYNLGLALKDSGQFDEVIASYRRAIALQPHYPRAYNNLGNALKEAGQVDLAIAALRTAVALKPDYAEAHNNLGSALRDADQLDEAMAACQRTIALSPGFPEAHTNLGNALRDKGLLDEAIGAHRRAIALRPDFAEAHSNLAAALKDQGQLDEAIGASRKAVAVKPGDADGHYNHALILLSCGHFAEGWVEHEWRWRIKEFPSIPWKYSQPQWDGSDLGDRSILIHCEQGFGDVIQFIRYLPMVAARCRRVIVGCYPQLRRLLKPISVAAEWVNTGDAWPHFDVHCPLMSLPLALGTTVQTIPASVPYLHAEPLEVAQWRDRLSANPSGLKVGLVWAGRPTHKNDRNRSLSLSALSPLAQVRGVTYHSLQKGEPAIQAKRPPAGMRLIDHTEEELNDFADTAALIANLDLVISVDSAVAHLAGALGKPAWVLAPAVSDWRWFLEREDSPWYPTLRLFRQQSSGNWNLVIERVARRLEEIT